MLYILECMLRVITSIHGGTSKSLSTTGEPATFADFCVGMAGLAVCIIIIHCIARFFRKSRKRSCEQIDLKSESKMQGTEQPPSKIKWFYLLECMALGLFVLHGGKNKPMLSTGKKPTWKDAVSSVICWSTVACLIFLVIMAV